jgi:hypothetical protein
MMKTIKTTSLLLLAALCACDDRDPIWDARVASVPTALGMNAAVAVIDDPVNRALVLPVTAELELTPASIPIGQGFANAAATPNGERLLVLSRGVVPRRTADDEGPSVTVIGATPEPRLLARYELSDPLSRLAVDPLSRFAVAYPSPDDGSFLHNPNELVIMDLERGPAEDNPAEITLRSFGGRPERLLFTPDLHLPGGERRLLIAQTDRDVLLLDLAHLDVPEITIPLTSGPTTLAPATVAVTDGDPDRDDDARIAILLENDPNVIVVDLLPVSPGEADDTPQSFRAAPNVVFVGGAPSDVAFVTTDGGLRLAAVVPSAHALTLVDPVTGIATDLDLGGSFDRISVVTSIVGAGEDGSDVALLWSSGTQDIAFVALGSTVGKPYKSIEHMALPERIFDVLDVPAPNERLKVLPTYGGNGLFVLDLVERTAAPIEASVYGSIVTLAPNGERAWVVAGNELGRLDLETLHPMNLILSRNIQSVFEVARSDGGRALVALHAQGALGATVLDAREPSLAAAREYFGLLLGGL